MNVAYSMKHAKGIEGEPKSAVNQPEGRLLLVYKTAGIRQGSSFIYLYPPFTDPAISTDFIGTGLLWREFPQGAVVTLTQD